MSGSTTEDIPRLLALARVGDRTAVGRLLGEYRGYLSILARLHDDGQINGLDVDPFLAAVLSGEPNGLADMNQDGVVNGLDVDPFVSAVVGGNGAAAERNQQDFSGTAQPPQLSHESSVARLAARRSLVRSRSHVRRRRGVCHLAWGGEWRTDCVTPPHSLSAPLDRIHLGDGALRHFPISAALPSLPHHLAIYSQFR
jgi:hypothetical protein